MRQVRVLLAEQNLDLRDHYATALATDPAFSLLETTDHGETLYQLAKNMKPDLIISSHILFGVDALTTMHKLKKCKVCPPFILLTTANHTALAQDATKVGASFVLRKPTASTSLIDVALHMTQALPQAALAAPIASLADKFLVAEILLEFTLLPKLKGTHYLRYSILVCYAAKGEIALMNEIYPAVAQSFRSTPNAVETSIRKAVETAWQNTLLPIKEKYFGASRAHSKTKPTSGEFIATIAEWMQREKSKEPAAK